jgi:putative ABC transport system permease protein
MKYLLIGKQSVKGITSNKVRSFLTILGIVIGIGSVIALVSLVAGVKSSVTDQINKLGTTNIIISSGKSQFGQAASGQSSSGQGGVNHAPSNNAVGGLGQSATLTIVDYNSLADKKVHPDIKTVSGAIAGSSAISTTDGEQTFQVSGSPTAVFDIQGLTISKGRLYSTQDINANARVAVLGSQVSKDAFGSVNPVGKTITIGKQTYTVVGILNEKTGSSFSNPNADVYVPYTSLAADSGVQNFTRLTAEAKNESVVDSVKKDVEATLLKNHGITDVKKADFSVMTSADLLASVSTVTGLMSALLGGIAAISLVVGGIGIMNIMLVSVTERTREIGLRKAVGAKTRDILVQFLIEAIILTLLGGIFGIALGYAAGLIIAKMVSVTPVITASSIVLAVGVSALVGIIFGIYPAIKASLMSPIDALRYE